MTLREYIKSLEVGNIVTLLDTSNERERMAVVRKIHGKAGRPIGLQVFVTRFNSLFELDRDGKTNLGRFKLLVP